MGKATRSRPFADSVESSQVTDKPKVARGCRSGQARRDFVLFSQSARLIGCRHYGRDLDGSRRRPCVRTRPDAFAGHVGSEQLALVVVARADSAGYRIVPLDCDVGDGSETRRQDAVVLGAGADSSKLDSGNAPIAPLPTLRDVSTDPARFWTGRGRTALGRMASGSLGAVPSV